MLNSKSRHPTSLVIHTWTKDWKWTATLGHYLPEHFLTQHDTLINCPQHVILDTQHLLYENPLPPVTTQTIEFLHDTGASISMLPAQFTFSWTNVHPCLHRISGCFKGGEQDNNEIGEFHALVTENSTPSSLSILERQPEPSSQRPFLPLRLPQILTSWRISRY